MPLHTPGEADKTLPSTAAPEIDGGLVFAGAVASGCTTAVAADITGPADPAEFVAVTPTAIVEPTSAVTSVYVELVAPLIGAHEPPPESQRDH